MWLGVCAAIVTELVPNDLTASAVAVYFFIIQIIGGNMTLLVTPLTEALNYRAALLILFPGMYIAAALFFLLTFAMVSYREKKSGKGGKSYNFHNSSDDVSTTVSSAKLNDYDQINLETKPEKSLWELRLSNPSF